MWIGHFSLAANLFGLNEAIKLYLSERDTGDHSVMGSLTNCVWAKSARSNSRVLEEAENSVDRVSSESFSNGVKIKNGVSLFENFKRNDYGGQTVGVSMEVDTKSKYWTVVGPDFCIAVKWFFDHGDFAIGCNSSFVALIPKVLDPKVVSDYRPINVQTAFLPNRQILDGPFIINEILARCKLKKQQAMIFKVDFAKAYDSVRWDYLDDVLISFGFGPKWRIQ
ncbi:hypothetical protein Tco_0768083 [Tanacetum coccineum]